MTDLIDELLPLERALAAGGSDAYRARLSADAILVVPGQVLDRDAAIAAMDAGDRWDAFGMDGPRALALGDHGAVLTYTFTGRRGDLEYRGAGEHLPARGRVAPRLPPADAAGVTPLRARACPDS